ncbi:hypothetical protein HanIR_Chr13g0660261 [Helianthus annuus]|nr:hypothetical protein HanIR_Chr13g0660261 [Helianthus annuus]
MSFKMHIVRTKKRTHRSNPSFRLRIFLVNIQSRSPYIHTTLPTLPKNLMSQLNTRNNVLYRASGSRFHHISTHSSPQFQLTNCFIQPFNTRLLLYPIRKPLKRTRQRVTTHGRRRHSTRIKRFRFQPLCINRIRYHLRHLRFRSRQNRRTFFNIRFGTRRSRTRTRTRTRTFIINKP